MCASCEELQQFVYTHEGRGGQTSRWCVGEFLNYSELNILSSDWNLQHLTAKGRSLSAEQTAAALRGLGGTHTHTHTHTILS